MNFQFRKLGQEDIALLQYVGRATYEPYYPHVWKTGGLDWYMEKCFGEKTLLAELSDSNIEYLLFTDQDGQNVGFMKLVLKKTANAYKRIAIGSGYNAKTETRYGLINSSGKLILPLIYITVFNAGEPGVYEVKDTMANMALYNAVSQKFITEFAFYDIDRFSEGLAVVKKRVQISFKRGAVDTKGNIVIPVEYEYLGGLKEGLMNYKKESKMGYMDRNMKVVIPESYYNMPTSATAWLPSLRRKPVRWDILIRTTR